MHLKALEVQGFKTFAKKTGLSFLPPQKHRYPITAIVGPNGSGKSNLSDAIRWVLGEQSLKLLRGKKSEDVIFSGSQGKSQAGFADVSITLDNSDNAMPIDYKEVLITRRLFRDGSSEYLLNQSKVRLADIHLLLAQANVGQKSYSVIGQGMIDHILVASPEERKTFFDDATGVKQFQLKRHRSVLKLKRTLENLSDVEMLIKEIEPRLRSLKRQASRLEKREQVETELKNLETKYYGTLYWNVVDELEGFESQSKKINKEIAEKQKTLKGLEQKTEKVEDIATDAGMQKMQAQYREVQKRRNSNRDKQFETQKEIELSKVRAQSNWAPLPLIRIVAEVKEVIKGLKILKNLKTSEEIIKNLPQILKRSESLASKLERPNPEDIKPDKKLVNELKHAKEEGKKIEEEMKKLEKEMDLYVKEERKSRTDLIEMQKELRVAEQMLHKLENDRNQLEIEMARLNERKQNLIREMDEFMKSGSEKIRKNSPPARGGVRGGGSAEKLYPDIQRLRYKLELIGGIDPEIVQEFSETKERFNFLDTQVKDLHQAIKATEKIVKELDEKIEAQSKKAFQKINKKFEEYFKILFDGGSCSLVKLTSVVDDSAATASLRGAEGDEAIPVNEVDQKLEKHKDPVVGIEIQATPPGKKLKALNLLSGGERALTSIALVSAIMAVNPSPFVILDEVDAALDETNTLRFASILEDLSKKSQFVIITHNRATMEKADVLYGVTMGDDGVSNLLSIQMEEVQSAKQV